LRRLSTLLLTQTAKFLVVNTSSNPNHRRELLRRKRALLFTVVKEKRRAGHSMFLANFVWNPSVGLGTHAYADEEGEAKTKTSRTSR